MAMEGNRGLFDYYREESVSGEKKLFREREDLDFAEGLRPGAPHEKERGAFAWVSGKIRHADKKTRLR